MSGGRRQAQLAGGRPLDEGVRALVEEKHFLGRKPHFKNRPMGAETGRGPLLYKPELSNLGDNRSAKPSQGGALRPMREAFWR